MLRWSVLEKPRERCLVVRGGSRTAATSKIERFVIIVNGWKPLTIISKHLILDVAAVLDLALVVIFNTVTDNVFSV